MDAVIFDMDGVISDTEKLHGVAESQTLKAYGIVIPPEELSDRFAGVPETTVWEIVFDEWKKPLPPKQQLRDEKFLVLSALAEKGVQQIPGSLALVKLAMDHGIKRAIASSSRPEFIAIVTRSLGIGAWFDAIVSGVEVEHGKPAPNIFLLAAKRLDVQPERCMVIGDARSGCMAAKAAGMKCIGFLPSSSKQNLSMADLVVPDLRDIRWETINSL